MTRIFRIKKSEAEGMPTFRINLERALEESGLENIGRIETGGVTNQRFPITYGFESAGEGGFIVQYEEGLELYSALSERDIIKVDATLCPLGATGSLVQRTYEYLKQVSAKRGYETSEMKLKPRF